MQQSGTKTTSFCILANVFCIHLNSWSISYSLDRLAVQYKLGACIQKNVCEYTKRREVFVPLRRMYTRKREMYLLRPIANSRSNYTIFSILTPQKRYIFVIEAQNASNETKKNLGCTPPLNEKKVWGPEFQNFFQKSRITPVENLIPWIPQKKLTEEIDQIFDRLV